MSVRPAPLVEKISVLSRQAKGLTDELDATMFYAHRMIDPPLSLRALAAASGLSPSGVLGRISSPKVRERAEAMFGDAEVSPDSVKLDDLPEHLRAQVLAAVRKS